LAIEETVAIARVEPVEKRQSSAFPVYWATIRVERKLKGRGAQGTYLGIEVCAAEFRALKGHNSQRKHTETHY
jgi:hypothetical protein